MSKNTSEVLLGVLSAIVIIGFLLSGSIGQAISNIGKVSDANVVKSGQTALVFSVPAKAVRVSVDEKGNPTSWRCLLDVNSDNWVSCVPSQITP